MIALLSSNLLSLPELPSLSRIKSRRPFARYHQGVGWTGDCPKEMNRWIGRWENEGGAIRSERNRPESAMPTPAREGGNFRATDEKTVMKQTNHHDEEMIRYGDPLMGGGWRKRRAYPAINYHDRSPEVAAMNAHLRASAYDEQEGRKQAETASRLTNGAAVARNRMRSFLHLGRQYDTKARANFVREAMPLALLVTLSAWAIISAVQALAARW